MSTRTPRSEGDTPGRSIPEAFVGGDVELLSAVLSFNDSMLGVAQAVKLIERVSQYPIRSIDDLRPVFRQHGKVLRLGQCRVTEEQAATFLRPELFPVESREELISRMLIAFEAARLEHLETLSREQSTRALGRDVPKE
jgi:hypothetical protein